MNSLPPQKFCLGNSFSAILIRAFYSDQRCSSLAVTVSPLTAVSPAREMARLLFPTEDEGDEMRRLSPLETELGDLFEPGCNVNPVTYK